MRIFYGTHYIQAFVNVSACSESWPFGTVGMSYHSLICYSCNEGNHLLIFQSEEGLSHAILP